jgi:hypothetical protein
VSIRYQADNDLNQIIVAATYRREPGIDFQSAVKARLNHLDDLTVLQRAASEGRILVTHDKRTMPGHFVAFLSDGNNSPGVFLVIPQDAPLQSIVEALVLIWADDTPQDWKNAITIIPF